jgi:hypothetical protein
MSLSYKERIVNFFTQKINNGGKILNFYDIEEEYYNLLSDIIFDTDLCDIKRKLYFSVLYKLILYTRDSVYGINNSEASYIMLGALIQFGYNNQTVSNEMNILAFNALSSFTQIYGFKTAYGNWNDIKYFCNYLKNVIANNNKNDVTDYQIFKDIIDLYANQLANEEEYLDIISTATPFMPREKSKVFGWLAYYISTGYYQAWINTATTNDAYIRAVRKCLTHYRALLANPNKLPLTTYGSHKESNKNIDTWTKLLFEVSNDRYVWGEQFSHTILESINYNYSLGYTLEDTLAEENLLQKTHESISKEIEDDLQEEPEAPEEEAPEEEAPQEEAQEEEEPEAQEEADDFCIEISNDIAVNPLFDEKNEKKDTNNKKTGWFGWLGWN